MSDYRGVTPEGTSDLLFAECEARRAVEDSLLRLFKSIGYSEIITPELEYYDVFSNRFNAVPQEMMVKIIDSRGRILVLRPDNTMPIARVAATRLRSFSPPLRLCYNQQVYRMSPLMSGHSRQHAQCGVELIGAGGRKADLEIAATAVAALRRAAKIEFKLELGHVGFYRSIIDSLALGPETSEKVRDYIEAKNYSALRDLLEPMSADSAGRRALMELPRLFGGAEVFEKALALAPNERSAEAIRYLNGLYDDLCAMGLRDNVMIDLGLVGQIDYYSGVVFRGFVQGSGETVLLGGRYDGLLSAFGADQPATGFAVNVDAVAKTVEFCREERDSVLLYYEKGYEKQAFEYRSEAVSRGTMCEMSVFETPEESEAYAKLRGIRRFVALGKNQVEKEL